MLIFSIKAQTSRCLSYKCSYTNSTAYSYSCRKALPFYPKGETLQRAAQRAERVQQQCLQMLQIHRLQALIRSQFPHSCKNRDPFFLNVVYFLWFLAVKKKKASQIEAPKPHKRQRHAPHPGSASAAWRSPAELSGSVRSSAPAVTRTRARA